MALRIAREGLLQALLGNFGGCGGLVSIEGRLVDDLLAHRYGQIAQQQERNHASRLEGSP